MWKYFIIFCYMYKNILHIYPIFIWDILKTVSLFLVWMKLFRTIVYAKFHFTYVKNYINIYISFLCKNNNFIKELCLQTLSILLHKYKICFRFYPNLFEEIPKHSHHFKVPSDSERECNCFLYFFRGRCMSFFPKVNLMHLLLFQFQRLENAHLRGLKECPWTAFSSGVGRSSERFLWNRNCG